MKGATKKWSGGNANNAANCGSFYSNANNSSSNTNATIGAEILHTIKSLSSALPLGRIITPNVLVPPQKGRLRVSKT